MKTLYGKYPKRITCECNAEEMSGESITIYLSNRCPECNTPYRISVPKPDVKMTKLQHLGTHLGQTA